MTLLIYFGRMYHSLYKTEEKYEQRNVCSEVYVTEWEMLTRFCNGHTLIENSISSYKILIL